MGRLRVHDNQCSCILDGKPFFYLGDTVWSAFTNITMEEWEYYLSVRKKQGFTVLQINTMPQWDRCMTDVGVYPFATKDGQTFDFTRWNDDYYVRARQMCRMAVEQGFQLALVVLWLNYVPGTWGSRMISSNIMPEELVEEYTRRIVAEFDEFHPIYVVSGDTDFDTPEAVRYYRMALEALCERSPESLKTMHIKRGYDVIPEEFLEHLDFYMFQSGHNAGEQHMAYELPKRLLEKYPKKPIINAEPCYEQMGYSRKEYGRFLAKDTRRAAWSSLLSGACGGVTYGAHGVWNWQKVNKTCNPVLGEGFDEPIPWQDAIRLPGAWDYGYIRYILEQYHITELTPVQEHVGNPSEKIRMAAAGEMYLVYLPYNTKAVIKIPLDGYGAKTIDLQTKCVAYTDVKVKDGHTVVGMHPFEGDALVILEKQSDR